MPIQTSQNRIDTGETGWISIHINSESPISHYDEKPRRDLPVRPPAACHLFEHVEKMQTPFPERFPRLTFLAIAFALLASALAAEFDYLHGAGYSWP